MDSKELTNIALKLFAIYVMIQAILAAPSYFNAYVLLSNGTINEGGINWFILIGLTSVVLLVGLSIFIWKLSNKTIKQVESKKRKLETALTEEFILSALGLFLVFNGLVNLSFASVSAYYQSSNPANDDYFFVKNAMYLLAYVAQLLIGITLIIRASGWAALLKKLREAGLGNKPSNN